jgi:lipoprotein-releasing system permease protein
MFTVTIDMVMLVEALTLATLTGLLAALAPAVRAARLDPVVAIRGYDHGHLTRDPHSNCYDGL